MILSLIISLVVSVFGFPTLAAEQNSEPENIELSEEERQLAQLVSEHVFYDTIRNEMVILNESALVESLKGTEGNIDEIKNGITEVNLVIDAYDPGTDEYNPMNMCSNALSVLGLAHGTSLGAAAIILGLNPWLALGVATSAGAIYVGGGFFCP